MTPEVWPKEAITYLKNNFRKYSNIELATLLNKRWQRLDKKAFTGLNVNHKLTHLGLARTKRDKQKISKRCRSTGVYKSTGAHRLGTGGPIGDLSIRVKDGRAYVAIKTGENSFRPLKNFVYEKLYGEIPAGSYVALIDGHELNCHRDNLILRKTYEKAQLLTQQLDDRYAAGVLAKGKPGFKELLLSNKRKPQLEHWKANITLRREMLQRGIPLPKLPVSKKIPADQRKNLAWPATAKRYVRMFFRRLSDIELVARLNAKYFPDGGRIIFTTGRLRCFMRHNSLRRGKQETKYVKSRNVINGSYTGNGNPNLGKFVNKLKSNGRS